MKVLLVLVFWLACANSAKILGVFHVASFSHFSPGQTLLNALVDQGHDVTVIAPYNDKASKFKLIELTGIVEEMEEFKKQTNMFEMDDGNIIQQVFKFHGIGSFFTENTLKHPNVQKLIKSNEKYDVVIIEQFVNEAFHGLCHHFGASCVVYSALHSNYWLNPLMGNPENPAYMSQMNLKNSNLSSFCSRVFNTILLAFETLVFHGYVIPQQNDIMQKYIPNTPPLKDILFKTDLILLNSHVSYSEPRPHVPGMVEIGGFHVKPAKALPQDLQKYLDEAKEGVVYFSMGSVLKGTDLPQEKRQEILKAFAKLKQKVLWKFEEEIKGVSPNVKIVKWAPQNEILAHPNVKLFITHGGLSSKIEAVHFGVPVVGIPIFGDQNQNMQSSERAGLGVTLQFNTLTEASILNAVHKILDNKQYSENAKKRSELLRDRPMKPIDTAVYWVEHIVRNKGGQHLRSAALDLAWYQVMLVDVCVLFGAIGLVGLWLTCFCLRKFCCKKKEVTKVTSVSKDKKKK